MTKPTLERYHSCSGVKSSGYWKGEPCAAFAKHEYKGKWYCARHLVVAQMKDKENDKNSDAE